jgi:hypothetical protein
MPRRRRGSTASPVCRDTPTRTSCVTPWRRRCSARLRSATSETHLRTTTPRGGHRGARGRREDPIDRRRTPAPAESCDLTVIADRPGVAPRREEMRTSLARTLDVQVDRVSIKGHPNRGPRPPETARLHRDRGSRARATLRCRHACRPTRSLARGPRPSTTLGVVVRRREAFRSRGRSGRGRAREIVSTRRIGRPPATSS